MKLGVILMNLGGPGKQGEIRPFLASLFSDREIIRLPGGPVFQPALAQLIAGLRLSKVRRNYRQIGGGSPLLDLTRRQAEGLAAELGRRGFPARVAVAMRYSRPRADDALLALARGGFDRLVAVSLYPQYSRATTGSSVADLLRAMGRTGITGKLALVERYPEHPGYLDALALKVREGLRPESVVLFSAHGLPEKLVRAGDPYVGEIERTVAGVRARLPAGTPWRLGYQSRVGPVKWVGPDTEEVIRDLGREGARDVLAVPVAFVSDHIETLQEIDILYAGVARAAGIPSFRRSGSLNDSPAFLEALADLVLEAVA
ncbi:MAG: ferrochelatase [Planctomycetes bacterium]|jgi:ferrochelatase|nr:ferrochelatase [Planctomycetota bacterium]